MHPPGRDRGEMYKPTNKKMECGQALSNYIYIYVKTVNNFFPRDKFRVIKIHFLKISYNKNEILRVVYLVYLG